MPTDRRWSDAAQELVTEAIHDYYTGKCAHIEACEDGYDEQDMAGAVLDALTADGWRREADVRADAAEEIAQAIEAMVTDHPLLDRRTAADIARAHATTPEPTDRTEEKSRDA